jgi:hypothetical protein
MKAARRRRRAVRSGIEMSLLIAGDSVLPAKFGLGAAQPAMGSASKSEAIIDFSEECGAGHLVLRYAPLEKLSGAAARNAVTG